MNVYHDSSCLVKLYIREDRSDEVFGLVAEAELNACSWVTYAEVISAIGRVRRSAMLPERAASEARSNFERDQNAYIWLDLGGELSREAAVLAWEHGLRGFDAIHLASAMRWRRMLGEAQITFATFDRALAAAAGAEGLSVWPARS